jgi:hypothetical protein
VFAVSAAGPVGFEKFSAYIRLLWNVIYRKLDPLLKRAVHTLFCCMEELYVTDLGVI